MSKFEVTAVRIDDVTDHPDADRLSLNKIGGFVAVSNKLEDGSHRYAPGDLVVYVPEGAVVPIPVLEQFGYTNDKGEGILAGSKGDRVKAIKLRGVLSQGLIFPLVYNVEDICARNGDQYTEVIEGTDLANFFGITKYEPVIPAGMSGDLIGSTKTIKFDVENGQKYTDVFDDDDYVYVTEKLHGTFAALTFSKTEQEGWLQIYPNVWATAYSKGLGAKGLVFKDTEKNRQSNLYIRALLEFIEAARSVQLKGMGNELTLTDDITFMGEIYGRGVQDLAYTTQKPEFAVFDMILGSEYVPYPILIQGCDHMVPLLWEGYYSEMPPIETLRDGKSTIDNSTIREGIVIRAADATDRNEKIGRKMVKYVSPDYLTRKNGTEYT